jgi:HlyD family secretion protein
LTAKATVGVGQAAVSQAKAMLNQAQATVVKNQAMLADADANLKRSQINLGYCTITSPVKGVIIDRRVNVGQTVVSSLNSPSLFLIAKDLKRMQVWASVNEADVGSIRPGQSVKFTVEAYAGRTFRGTVAPDQPRLNASMTQNVVTYTVVVTTDNSDGKLLPYSTANLEFEVSRHQGVLLVPTAALRFRPDPQSIAPDVRESDAAKPDAVGSQRRSDTLGASSATEPTDTATAADRQARGTLWVENGESVRPISVRIGLTDGIKTEVAGDGVKEGIIVVTGENRQDKAVGTTNPFTPQMFGGRKQQQP